MGSAPSRESLQREGYGQQSGGGVYRSHARERLKKLLPADMTLAKNTHSKPITISETKFSAKFSSKLSDQKFLPEGAVAPSRISWNTTSQRPSSNAISTSQKAAAAENYEKPRVPRSSKKGANRDSKEMIRNRWLPPTPMCLGCGAEFQNKFPTKPGYLPQEILEGQRRINKQGQMNESVEGKDIKKDVPFVNVPLRKITGLHDEPDYEVYDLSEFRKRKRQFNSQKNVVVYQENLDIENVNEADEADEDHEANEESKDSGLEKERPNDTFPIESAGEYKENPNEIRDHKDDVVCARCFQLRNYGKVKSGMKGIIADDFRKMIANLDNIEGSVIVKVVDITDFYGTFVRDIGDLVGGRAPIILVLNKCDLLHCDANPNHIRAWVYDFAKRYKISLQSIHPISALKGLGLARLMKEATELARKGKRNVFVVGSTNAGKSTLVNSLLKRKYIVPLKTKSLASVTASSYPGTTLAPIPFGLMGPSVSVVSGERKQKRIKKCALFDCPGVIQSGHLNHMLNFAELKNVQIQSKIQPIQLKVRSGQHLLLGALGSIQLLSDLSVWATCFTSKRISLHVTASDNFESLLSDKVGSVIYPPFRPERMKELPKWNSREIEFDPGELPKNKYRSVFDIWFSGLGWVNIQARGKGKIRVQSPGYYEFADPIPTRFEPYLKIDRFKGRSPTGMSEKELKRHRISPL